MKKLLLSSLFIFFLFGVQSQLYDFRHFNPDNGLNGTYVYSIIEDSKEYKWIGTDFGLLRFDGLNFEAIDLNDSTKINFPTAGVNTKKNRLLFGYYNGQIKEYNGVSINTVYKPDGNTSPIRGIIADEEILWAITQNEGIVRIDQGNWKLLGQNELGNLKANTITKIDDIIYVGTNDGISRYQIEEEDITYLGIIPSLEGYSVQKIIKSNEKNTLWVGTNGDGIFKVVLPKNDSSIEFKSDQQEFLNRNEITAIIETKNNDLWVGTKYDGLIKINFNRDNKKPIQFTYLNTSTHFPGDKVSSLFLDKDDHVWAGTVGDGLVQVVKKGLIFYNFERFKATSVNAITGTNQHQLYFGTDKGIVKGYQKGNTDTLSFELLDNQQIKGKEITAMYTHNSNTIYFAIKGEGLFKTDLQFENIQKLSFSDSLKDISIRQITMEGSDKIWLSVMYNGIFVIDTVGNVKQHYSTKTGFYHNEIFHIHIDTKGNKWFAAKGAGLAIMRKGTTSYLSQEGIFPARDINDISEDESGNIWIGTNGNGIFEYDGENFIRFDKKNGLLNDYTKSIISDQSNHIWVSHRLGLSRLDENTNALSTVQHKDGLQVAEFIQNSIFRDQDHNIWLGNRNGVTFLNSPDEMFEPKILETHITDIKIDYNSVDLYEFAPDDVVSGQVPSKLKLPHNKNHLTFEFIAINLKNPESNLYQSKLEGFENKWSPPTQKNSIDYTNLAPGNYIFHIRQSENPNHWGDNITSYSFTVKPAWYNTWLARIIIVSFITFSIYRFWVFRLNQLKNRYEEKQKLYKITENQNQRLMNFSFITSHNTRASVGNILGIINALEMDPTSKEYFRMLKETALKLNKTIENINELLNFENNTEVQMTKCNLLEILERTIVLNDQLIQSRQAELNINIQEDIYIEAVPSYLESILNNILTNALRYGVTELSKNIDISCNINERQVVVRFKDYGMGIDLEKHQSKLFKLGSRFHSSKSDGQGLGLFMTKSQIEAIGGKIEVESAENKGTLVSIFLNAYPK